MKKVIAAIAASGVLVAGAFVATSVTGPSAAQAAEDTATEQVARPRPGAILDEVLGELVADGTLDQSQADAVKDALAAKRDELKEKFGDRPPRPGKARRAVLREMMSDDVITADEIASLPEDDPLRTGEGPLAELLEDDGQITRDELDAFIEQRRAEREAEANTGG